MIMQIYICWLSSPRLAALAEKLNVSPFAFLFVKRNQFLGNLLLNKVHAGTGSTLQDRFTLVCDNMN